MIYYFLKRKEETNVKKILITIGVIIMTLSVAVIIMNGKSKPLEYEKIIENVGKLKIDSDIANIHISTSDSQDSNIRVEYRGESTFLADPEIDIISEKGQATIKLKAIHKKWMYLVPKRSRGELLLKIPPILLEQIQINTGNGNIEVKNLSEVNELILGSKVGNINIDSFQGKTLGIDAKNGSINLGLVDGEVNINNQTGSLKGLTFSEIKGKNNIKLSNGSVKLNLPSGVDLHGVATNISTKNGKIKANNSLLGESIVKQGPGQKIVNRSKGQTAELNISVSVGNIEIN